MSSDLGKCFQNSNLVILIKTLSIYDLPVKSKNFVDIIYKEVGVAQNLQTTFQNLFF